MTKEKHSKTEYARELELDRIIVDQARGTLTQAQALYLAARIYSTGA